MSACPVYSADHKESHVSRGRNMLIIQAANGADIPEDELSDVLSYCLLCGRCEAVCPARVPSTDINLQAREKLMEKNGLTLAQKVVHGLLLKHRSTATKMLGLAAILPGVSTSGGRPLRHLADLASVLTSNISLPKIPSTSLSNQIPYRSAPPHGSPVRGQAAFFPGCYFELFFPEVGKDIVSALVKSGYEVVFPSGLTCCGLAIYNTGDHRTARLMAKHNIEALSKFDHIVTGCATCGAALKGYGKWLSADPTFARKAAEVSAKVYDSTEFLTSHELPTLKAPPNISTVTYHDPCHLRWRQGIHAAPRDILRSIKGLTFVEMDMAEKCCGQGGSFGVKHPETSLSLLKNKMDSARKTGAEAIVTSCPGCMVQLIDGARRRGLPVKVMHIGSLMNARA